jgi:NIMA (never in mitosis gene a)-related kinase
VVQALAHTHSRGIVHRDLTAANVLLAPYSSGAGSAGSSCGSSGPGCAKLVDFGLAKHVSGSLVQQSVVGTLAYSCPELVTQDR